MIELRDLTKTFQTEGGPVRVLKGISLTVQKSEVFGVIGRSGAGKSTLVRCINLLERPTSGQVIVAGQEITALRGRALRQARHSIGMIFQHFNLLSSRTALENVALALELAGRSRRAARAAAAPLLELVGLADKRGRYPAELSGGEKQRVGIARALASEPAVLLCDEATSALDPETTQSILALLRDINRKLGLTVVLITHEMQVIKEICDRVAVLEHGEIAEMGPVFDVFTAPTAEVTRRFVRDLVDRELPANLVARLNARPELGGNPVLRIVFRGPSAHSPVVAEVVRQFGILLNILQATVDYIQGAPYGNVIVEAIGGEQDVARAIDFIRGKDLKVEVLGHVAGDARAVA
ncbi:methionine ABC transporter ATP-binding protein [Anaeromyxobacter oryzisoli]|jgi:D-methionine transport system ATP-binding protein|uniref:methionine ABC transporter ATP-binding protein n=1 Tax=Anaeromyxobacter oryzisoli TaxID=2925408 RepID=UPI001F59BB2E|nr:methionine ABC transporter ATP-binding protein [Anaeromyxobacter sp. SG63]